MSPQHQQGEGPLDGLPRVRAKRPALWLLLVPAVLYCAAPLVANRIEPRVLGLPFLLFWIVAATVVSPLVIWLVSRLDPAFRDGAVEPLPVDEPTAGGPR
ncbi:DUF3311 domain-containing protein [Streptomyces smyrnaeus]|uniref:DUF3311 domain-containing protein n=1 Tax=Streptomyces smyrnaeus TaxID=1387713 RepID=A0ABS3XNI5_9ACTN|nr:DUF3311 domain-containing protein [Streptomyces smyrnaeus]MBO8196963.1 DUF3311 domain-containing protein [Streptomyces smyrnaeus]